MRNVNEEKGAGKANLWNSSYDFNEKEYLKAQEKRGLPSPVENAEINTKRSQKNLLKHG